jgi:hypothetical protein
LNASVRARSLSVLLVAVSVGSSADVFAQMMPGGGMGGGMMGGGAPPPGGGGKKKGKAPAKKKVTDEENELHAAPGASDTVLGNGSEPSLPTNPLALSKPTWNRIGSDLPLDEQQTGRTLEVKRRFYGVYYSEDSGQQQLKLTLPPVWANRKQPSRTDPKVVDDASIYGMFYYHRRSAEAADDVLFPLVWNLRDRTKGERTTVVGPFVNRRTPDGRDDWFAPLYFTGKHADAGYTLIPPLLFYHNWSKKGGFTLAGPGFCTWKGGDRCDTRTAKSIDLGVAPLYFYGQSSETAYEIIPPLFHYYDYNDRDLSWVNTWGPFYRAHSQERDLLHIAPFYWSLWKPGARHTTIFPLFHYGYDKNAWLFANPLFVLGRGEMGESTFVTWLYARHRGRTELDMITPLYWDYRDTDAGVSQKLLFPFLYSKQSPRESTQAFFPFWAHSNHFGISKSTWITPLFQHTHDLRGWSTNIYPLVYFARDGKQSHSIIAPLFFDFVGTESRTTVGFPFYWRFSDLNSVTQIVGNMYYHEKKTHLGKEWEIHAFPAFSYGSTPDGHFFNVFYGLAGYSRRGAETTVRLLWIPIRTGAAPAER